jgi:hypothetical protein
VRFICDLSGAKLIVADAELHAIACPGLMTPDVRRGTRILPVRGALKRPERPVGPFGSI